jgi:hypothetical protein
LASKHKFLKAGFLAYILNISQVDANAAVLVGGKGGSDVVFLVVMKQKRKFFRTIVAKLRSN